MTFITSVTEELKRCTGTDVSGYHRGLVERRIAARMRRLGVVDTQGYLELLRAGLGECQELLDTIAINISWFFRNPTTYDELREAVIPPLLARKKAGEDRLFRAWSAGCAGGEEAYSVAILLHQLLKGEWDRWRVLIFGSDLDAQALARGRRGIYDRAAFRDTTLGILDTYFEETGDRFSVRPVIRRLVSFSKHDLTRQGAGAPSDSVFAGFDLVLCRNVLIYLEPEVQAKVLARLRQALASGGILVLGEAEAPDPATARTLQTVDAIHRIYRARGRAPHREV